MEVNKTTHSSICSHFYTSILISLLNTFFALPILPYVPCFHGIKKTDGLRIGISVFSPICQIDQENGRFLYRVGLILS